MASRSLNIHYFQHVPFEGPGCIADWAREKGHSITCTRFYQGETLPALADIDWLIVMGGPMGVHDEKGHPWLKAEKAFIRQAINAGKTVLGICLGAQLIADVLGARVFPGPQKEIGWFPVQFTGEASKNELFSGLPRDLTVFHWHGDTFDLPENALPLASSAACRNQGFLYDDRVLALQFHIEITPLSLGEMLQAGSHELKKQDFVQTADEISAGSGPIASSNRHLLLLLDRLVS